MLDSSLPASVRDANTPSISIGARADRNAKLGWMGDSRNAVIFIVGLIVVCGLSIVIGIATPLGSFGHDTLFLLSNGYRVAQGQIPHRDFSSAWGPVMFLIDAGGLMVSGMRPSGLGYASAIFGAVTAVWAFLIIRSRYSSAYAAALGVYTLLLVTAPFSIGNIPLDLAYALIYTPLDFGYAMIYNRYGYALFGIIIMECAAYASSAKGGIRQSTYGAASTGIALGLLTFLKISYAFVAFGFIIVTTIGMTTVGTHSGRVRRLIGLFGGFMLVAVPILSYLSFDLSDIFVDLATAATARRLALFWRPIGIVDSVQIISVLLIAGLSHKTVRLQQVTFALMSVVAGYVLLITNMQTGAFPLNAYVAVALAAIDRSAMKLELSKWLGVSPNFPRTFLLGICFLPLFVQNGISLAAAAFERQWPMTSNVTAVASSERGSDLQFRSATGAITTETTGAEYVKALDDGIDLLRRHSDHGGVLAFDEFNPFNYLLDRPPPRGGFAAAAYDYVFCDTAYPTADRFFGDAQYVMVRKYKTGTADSLETEDVAGLMAIYGPNLRSQFAMVEETERWVLWQRNNGNH